MFDGLHDSPKDVDLKKTYDAIVVGSGAAGGMAAHVLTSHGLKVLLLEAGKKLNIEQELRSMQWPYDHPRRGDMPPGQPRASRSTSTTSASPRTPQGLALRARLLVRPGLGRLRLLPRTSSSTRRTTRTPAPTTPGCARALLGGKTNIWGRLALRLSDYDFKAQTATATARTGRSPTPTSSRTTTGWTATSASPAYKEGLPHLPDSLFQRPDKLHRGRDASSRKALAEDGPRRSRRIAPASPPTA